MFANTPRSSHTQSHRQVGITFCHTRFTLRIHSPPMWLQQGKEAQFLCGLKNECVWVREVGNLQRLQLMDETSKAALERLWLCRKVQTAVVWQTLMAWVVSMDHLRPTWLSTAGLQVFEGHPQVWAGGRCSTPAALKPAIFTQTRIMWFYCLEQNGDSFLWAPQPRYG